MICENCGQPLLPGDDVISQAAGVVTVDGVPEVGDHFYMHGRCPGTPDHEERIRLAADEVRRYIPEYVLMHADEGHLGPLEEYHPKTSVDSFRGNLLSLLTLGHRRGPVSLEEGAE